MDKYNSDKAMQDKINRLTEENKDLKHKIDRLNNDKYKRKKGQGLLGKIGIFLFLLGVVLLGVLIYEVYKDYKSAKSVKRLQEEREALIDVDDTDVSDILPEYRKMYGTNSDLVGWIVVEGTDINYPVVQSKVYQEYYLDHNFDGEEDEAGAIFADARNDVFLPDDNIILYGHNMKNGSMFGTLQSYLNKNYYDEHKTISFDTLYDRHKYEIVSVGLSKISDESADTFKYYNFLNASGKKEFNSYAKNIKKLEAYDTGVSMKYGDKLITLSTCNSVEEDGRLFIIAREVK